MNQMSAPDLVSTSLADGVVTLTLGAMPAHPLSLAMITALHRALEQAVDDPATNVIVISGPGHIFCAGHDLKEITRHRADDDQGQAFLEQLFTACAQMMQAVTACPKPTIAMVDGIATAAGLQLVAACDLAFASERASFCLPGVNNGGFCTTPAVAVSRAVARKHVMELLLSGEAKSAQWALDAGLINRVVPSEELAQTVREFAVKLASRNMGPIATGKPAIHAQIDMTLDQAYAFATPVMIDHFMDPGRLAAEKSSKIKA